MLTAEIHKPLKSRHSNLWGFYFSIPNEIALKFKAAKVTRVVVTFNGTIQNHCAIMPSAEGPFIMLNKTLVKQLGIAVGQLVKIEIQEDTSEYGMPVCEEFEAVIFSDETVFDYFQTLTPGKKRNLIHLVNKIKSTDIKINRAMAIAHHLLESRGSIDFKQLNETIKEFNQKNKI